MSKAATPWGPAQVVDSVSVGQKADDREFASLVQLLQTATGERLVRFSYSTDGIARRGPVTMRAADLRRLRRALEKHPDLKEALLG